MARKKSEMRKLGTLDAHGNEVSGGAEKRSFSGTSKPAGGFDSGQTAAQAGAPPPTGSPVQMEVLKAAVAKGGVLFGSRSVLKALKLKNPKIIFIASNCPESARNDINSNAKISGTKIENFEGTGKQLGVFCGKPFAIASLAVMEEKKK